MKRILFTGPESTGKSSLARRLASDYDSQWVPEYARTYLEQGGGSYQEADLLEIAKGQLQLEDRIAQHAGNFLFVDTSMLVMKVWSTFKYGRCHPWIIEQLQHRHYDLWVLCGIDIPWEPDPMRENPNDRQALYTLYLKEVQQLNVSFIEASGTLEERIARIKKVIT